MTDVPKHSPPPNPSFDPRSRGRAWRSVPCALLSVALIAGAGLAIGATDANAVMVCEKKTKKGKKLLLRKNCKKKETLVQDLSLPGPQGEAGPQGPPGPAGPAQFAVISGTTNPVNQMFLAPEAGPVLLELDSSGGTSLSFDTTAASSSALITFSAECAVHSTGFTSYASIRILVDGNEISPTAGGDDAFCSSTDNQTNGSWTMNSITVVVPGLAAGSHSIEVEASTDGSPVSNRWWFGDTSLSVVAN